MTESVISLVAVIGELFATVEVESNMFRSSLMSKNTPRLRAPLVDTMTDPPTVRLGAANVDCRCLVVTQTHSVLSAFSFSLLDCNHPLRSLIQAKNCRVSELTSSGLQ